MTTQMTNPPSKPKRGHYWRSETPARSIGGLRARRRLPERGHASAGSVRQRRQGEANHPGLVVESGESDKSLTSLAATFPRFDAGRFPRAHLDHSLVPGGG